MEETRVIFGNATWPVTFDLLLWRHFSFVERDHKLPDTSLTRVLNTLNTMKFTLHVDSELDESWWRAVLNDHSLLKAQHG